MTKRGVGIGIVGMGFMGKTHLDAALSMEGGHVAAYVTSDPKKKRGDFRSIKGNFGGSGAKIDVSGINVHPGLEELLADDSVGLVDVCLPSYMHASATKRVLAAGKHVIVEKPIALKTADATAMIAAAKRSEGLLMVGQVLKFFPEFSSLEEAIQSETWGPLRALHLRRIIAKPAWSADSWFADPKKSGGMVTDLHIHDTDFVVYLFGKPKAVTSHGIVQGSSIDAIRTTYHFRRRRHPLITSEAGWINGGSLPFEHGYDAFFDRASLHFNSTHCPVPTLYQAKRSRPLKLKAVDGFRAELEEAVRAVRTQKVPPGLSPKNAAASLAVCQAESTSVRRGRTIDLK